MCIYFRPLQWLAFYILVLVYDTNSQLCLSMQQVWSYAVDISLKRIYSVSWLAVVCRVQAIISRNVRYWPMCVHTHTTLYGQKDGSWLFWQNQFFYQIIQILILKAVKDKHMADHFSQLTFKHLKNMVSFGGLVLHWFISLNYQARLVQIKERPKYSFSFLFFFVLCVCIFLWKKFCAAFACPSLFDFLKCVFFCFCILGLLVGNFYDKNGQPTDALKHVQKQIELAKENQRKQDDDRKKFPPCNSEFSAAKGSRVWCTNRRYSCHILSNWTLMSLFVSLNGSCDGCAANCCNLKLRLILMTFGRITIKSTRPGVPKLGYICLSEGVHLRLAIKEKKMCLYIIISNYLYMYQWIL